VTAQPDNNATGSRHPTMHGFKHGAADHARCRTVENRLGVKGSEVVQQSRRVNGSSTGHTGGTPAWNAAASAHKRRQASPLVSQFSDPNPLVEGRHELCPAYRPSGLTGAVVGCVVSCGISNRGIKVMRPRAVSAGFVCAGGVVGVSSRRPCGAARRWVRSARVGCPLRGAARRLAGLVRAVRRHPTLLHLHLRFDLGLLSEVVPGFGAEPRPPEAPALLLGRGLSGLVGILRGYDGGDMGGAGSGVGSAAGGGVRDLLPSGVAVGGGHWLLAGPGAVRCVVLADGQRSSYADYAEGGYGDTGGGAGGVAACAVRGCRAAVGGGP
jgi:hypothetical protein